MKKTNKRKLTSLVELISPEYSKNELKAIEIKLKEGLEYDTLNSTALLETLKDAMHARRKLFNLYKNIELGHYKDSFLKRFTEEQLTFFDVEIKYLKICIKTLTKSKANYGDKIRSDAKYNTVKWTGEKVDLIELVYAIYYSNKVNNGNVTLKQIVKLMEYSFSIELGDPYRTYSGIKDRQNSQARFLEELLQKFKEQIQL